MAEITEVLGLVDAYGYAKKWGFSLSRDEFGQIMANLPETLIEAEELAKKTEAAAVPLAITKEPPLNVDVAAGGEVNLTLEATGHLLTYVWQKRSSAGEWQPVRTSDQPGYSFYFSDAAPASYRCVVIDDFGRMMKSSITTVTVVEAGQERIVENPTIEEATYYQMQEILDTVRELAEAAQRSDTTAAASAEAAQTSERNADTSARAASGSATAATEANTSAQAAKRAAEASEQAASASATSAHASKTSAAASQQAAELSAANAGASETAAKASETAAAASAQEAREMRDAAAGYAGAATMGFMVDGDGDVCVFYKPDSEEETVNG